MFPDGTRVKCVRSGGLYVILLDPTSGLVTETEAVPAYAFLNTDPGAKVTWTLSQSKMEDGRFVVIPETDPRSWADLGEQFRAAMAGEIAANTAKGKWEDWRPNRGELVLELSHHVAKLYNALFSQDKDLVTEHSADCANILEKIHDLFGKVARFKVVTDGRAQAKTDWVEEGVWFTAMFDGPTPEGVRGTPVGRAQESRHGAVLDLISRILFDYNVVITLDDIVVKNTIAGVEIPPEKEVKYRCRACGKEWTFAESRVGDTGLVAVDSVAAVRTCGDAFCDGTCDPFVK